MGAPEKAEERENFVTDNIMFELGKNYLPIILGVNKNLNNTVIIGLKILYKIASFLSVIISYLNIIISHLNNILNYKKAMVIPLLL